MNIEVEGFITFQEGRTAFALKQKEKIGALSMRIMSGSGREKLYTLCRVQRLKGFGLL